MATSNNLVKGSLAICKTELAMIIWPVEEMGKNSVKPSITDITIVSKMVMFVSLIYPVMAIEGFLGVAKDNCKDWKELRDKKTLMRRGICCNR